MDPNATLEAMRHAAHIIDQDSEDPLTLEFVETFRALDQWLSRGGFPPSAWEGRNVVLPVTGDTLAALFRPWGTSTPSRRSMPAEGRTEEEQPR